MEQEQMYDIELPMVPGVDWVFWLQVLFGSLVLLILAGLVWWGLSLVWRGLRVQRRFKTTQTRLSQAKISPNEAVAQCFVLWQETQRHALLPPSDTERLAQALNPLCFSAQAVSSEAVLAWQSEALAAFKRQHAVASVAKSVVQRAKRWREKVFSKVHRPPQAGERHD